MISNLAKKVFLRPSDKVVRELSSYFDDIQEDLELIKELDVFSDDIYYGHPSMSIDHDSYQSVISAFGESSEENKDKLKKLVESYELFDSKG